MVESPQRIWIESDDECPYFYEAHELHDVEQDVIEYVRADLYAALEAQIAEARKALEPFAKAGELFPDEDADFDQWIYRPAAGDEYALSSNHLRAARRALEGGHEE